MVKCLFIFSLFFLPSQALWANSTLISTIAQVRNHVITSRELAIHKALDKILGSRLDRAKSDEPLELLIQEWLLFFEAKTFYNNPIPTADIENDVKKAITGLKKKGSWEKLSISQDEVRQKIARRREADRLYLFKKKASVLPVSLSDLESEYTQNRVRYGDVPFAEVRDKIRQYKAEENLNKRLDEWFQVLEKKYKVQRFAKFAPKVQE